ncbi:Cysteine and glycine-rich protein 2 [Holothuria leucospilota]|uniref:Cysteine and glycine-rich protein 2 n=1 Tax=Holothuria leucospilota TaxID=206669 RepID=A0A9Q1BDT3_HOLLE|nr:Cysteine and glycine-rich protein 2 [Holothuria leucospilota]
MAPKCPKCEKSVYPAEELKCNNFSYHKGCFRCFLCSTGLDSNNVNPHNDELYCKKCHGRKFGIKGYGFGQGAGALGMDEGERQGNIADPSLKAAPAMAGAYHSANLGSGERTGPGPWCPRCNGTVYPAEEKKGAGASWHNKCFTCAYCNKRLDSTTLCDKEGEIFCKACHGKNFGPTGVGYGIGAGVLQTR